MAAMFLWDRFLKFVPAWEPQPPSTGDNPLLTSLGLTVIDTIKFGDGRLVEDVLGGSGTYCSAGALMFTNHAPQLVAFKILAGLDFPVAVEAKMRTWCIDLMIEKEAQRKSVRGLLEYEDTTFGPKKFRYTTPVLQVEPEDLVSTAALIASAFHLLCHPDKVKQVIADLIQNRGTRERPFVVWEPAPPACLAEHFESSLQAVAAVDVFSPNHLELLRLCSRDQQAYSKSLVEECATRYLEAGIGPRKKGIVVIRAGEHGCMVKTSIERPATWLPAYYTSEKAEKVVDTTGAGNGFLGGFIRGYQDTGDAVDAAYYGSVAASYMLEQIGVPIVVRSDDGKTYWNGEDPLVRLKAFRSRSQPE